MFSECCVCFASFDAVCYEFDSGVWDVCVYKFSCEFVLCSAVIVEWLFEAVLMLSVMYGRRLFSRVLTITKRNEMGLYEVSMQDSQKLTSDRLIRLKMQLDEYNLMLVI